MKLVTSTERSAATDLTVAPIHLGRGGDARYIDGFDWDPATLADYEAATASDGPDGRLVMIFDHDPASPGSHWERHPAGAEVVVCLSGALTLVQRHDDGELEHRLGAGEAVINPPGMWHIIDSETAGQFMTITPGRGTDHEPR